MAKFTNTSEGKIILPDQKTEVEPGGSFELSTSDAKNRGIAYMVKAGMITETKAAKAAADDAK